MNTRANIIAVAAFVAALVALMVFAASANNVRRMQAGFLGVISPFLKTGSAVERKITAFREGMKTLNQLEQEVQQLRVVNKSLTTENQNIPALAAENNRLRNALGYLQRTPYKILPARIIARDASAWYSKVTIDRGSAHGIEPDMPVLTEEGLVGKTTAVSENSSLVVLISDETCKVAANAEGGREGGQGIVKGERASSGAMPVISLNFLSKQANLQPGQRILTSGVGGVFPPGIFIGAVREFKVRELDGYATIGPAVDLTTLQDVFVVVSEKKLMGGKR